MEYLCKGEGASNGGTRKVLEERDPHIILQKMNRENFDITPPNSIAARQAPLLYWGTQARPGATRACRSELVAKQKSTLHENNQGAVKV
eukprot:284814699_4